MKNCVKCTFPLNDGDRYCSVCGAEQVPIRIINNNYCVGCGTAVTHDGQYCQKCGKPVSYQPIQYGNKLRIPAIIKSLSDRMTVSIIFWLIIAGLQLLLGMFLLSVASLTQDWNIDYIWAIIVCFVLGGLNTAESIKMFKYKRKIMTDYVGIVWENRIDWTTCINYIWNTYVVFNCLMAGNVVSLFMAFLTASVIVIDFLSIKMFIRNNKESFIQLEKIQRYKVNEATDKRKNETVFSKNDLDPYFIEAGRLIIEKNKASIGMLQRVYQIGFNRAASIMDQLCDANVVGPENGTKPRDILMSMKEFDNYLYINKLIHKEGDT